jgi:hypothetical protein
MAKPRRDNFIPGIVHGDVSPPGWEGTTEAMKAHSEISNPFALAWWMSEEGYSPHDALNKDVLDAACEMFNRAGHNDGTPYASAGAKAGNEGPANSWEAQTENLEEIPEHEDTNALAGPGAMGGHDMNFGKDDSDEMLLDESERATGAVYPEGGVYPLGPSAGPGGADFGVHGTISDVPPETENHGETPISVEGEETNDEDESADPDEDGDEHTDDDDDEAEHCDDDDDDDAHADDDDDEARRDE